MSATPLPWKPDGSGHLRGSDGALVILSSEPFSVGFGVREGAKENSALAFLSVNGFEPLATAVREYLSEHDNPAPDYAHRHHLRERMREVLEKAAT